LLLLKVWSYLRTLLWQLVIDWLWCRVNGECVVRFAARVLRLNQRSAISWKGLLIC
jgi:hypothetical protein